MKNLAGHVVNTGNTERRSRISEVLELPNLIEIQTDLSMVLDEGLREMFEDILPIMKTLMETCHLNLLTMN